MEKFKSIWINPENFEKKEIETAIPLDIVESIQECLKNLEGETYIKTPIIIDPNNLGVIFGIMETDASGTRYKYKVSISPND